MGDACHHHHADGPPGEADIERALAVAGDRLTAEGERMTAARTRVLELLLAAGEPVKAYDLIARFGEDGQVSSPVAGDLGRAADAAGYAIERTTIEAHGRCPACQ